MKTVHFFTFFCMQWPSSGLGPGRPNFKNACNSWKRLFIESICGLEIFRQFFENLAHWKIFDPKLSSEIRNKSTRKMSVNNSMRFISAFFWYFSSDLLCKHGRQAARGAASQWHWKAGCSGSSKGSGRPIGEAMGNPGARDGGPTARTQKSPKTVKKIAPDKFEIRKTQIGYP